MAHDLILYRMWEAFFAIVRCLPPDHPPFFYFVMLVMTLVRFHCLHHISIIRSILLTGREPLIAPTRCHRHVLTFEYQRHTPDVTGLFLSFAGVLHLHYFLQVSVNQPHLQLITPCV